MNLKIEKIFGLLCSLLVISAALVLSIFGETINSNVFTAEQKDNFADFKGKSVSTTANLNWAAENGSKITKTTVKGLPSYLLSLNASNEGQRRAMLISTPKESVNISNIGRLFFVVQYSSENEKVEYTVNMTLKDGTDQLVCTAPLKGNSRQLVSFEIGFFSLNRRITELSLEFLSESNGDKISVSGPYYIEVDRTYADDFSLADLALPVDATHTDRGIFIADSTQKIGFSGRFLRPAQTKVNHLRLFITTGGVGGKLEIRYSYFNKAVGGLTTKSAYVTLKDSAENFSYLVPFDDIDSIISLSFLFDVARSGGITVHRVETTDLYLPTNKDVYGEISKCTYSANDGTVTVKGKIFHEFLIKHHDYTLYFYRLDGTNTVEDTILAGEKPVASSKMSSEFKMTYKAGRQDKLAVLSYYAIVASDGKEFVQILPEFHITKEESKIPTDNSQIKGLCTDSSLGLSGMGVGVSIVDVYLDRLMGRKKSGYIYSVGSTNFYFDSDYVNVIDKRVKKFCVAGSSVYLRLLSDDVEGIFYSSENVTHESKTQLFSIIDFLTSRYSDHSNGKIKGYVIGTAMNSFKIYGKEKTDISSVSRSVAEAMEVIALSASVSMPDARIILPVLTDNSGGIEYDVELFLHSLCNRIDEFGGLDFTVMLESSEIYFPTNSATSDKIEFNTHISSIENMMTRLKENSSSVTDSYIYFWNPDPSETDERLKPAYAYMYYRLLASQSCDSFILSTNRSLESSFLELVRNIDTLKNKNGEITDFVLQLLGASAWDEVIPGFGKLKIPVRIFDEVTESANMSAKGEFVLFDFSSSLGTLGWFEGDGCLSLSVISNTGEKFLSGMMENYDGNAEILYHFDRPEKLSMAPYLCFDLSVGENDSEKYSLEVTVRSGRNVVSARYVLSGGERKSIVVDISNIAEKAPIDSLSVCVDALKGNVENYRLYLYSVSALSETMDDTELEAAVHRARTDSNMGTISDSTSKTPDYEFVVALAGLLVVCVIVAGIYDRNKEK